MPHKIPPLLSHEVRVTDPHSYYRCRAKLYRGHHTLTVKYIRPELYIQPHAVQIMQRKFLIMMKKQKGVRTLRLNEVRLSNGNVQKSKFACIAKRMSRIHNLFLEDLVGYGPKYNHLLIWLKYAHKIRQLNYVMSYDYSSSSIGEAALTSFKRLVHNVYKRIKESRIPILSISERLFEDPLVKLFPARKVFSSSTKVLSFEAWRSGDIMLELQLPETIDSLELRTFESLGIFSRTLHKMMDYKNIRTFTLVCSKCNSEDLGIVMRCLASFSSLQKLSLDCNIPAGSTTDLFNALKDKTLLHLALMTDVDAKAEFEPLVALIKHHSTLQSLDLKIKNNNLFTNEEMILVIDSLTRLPLLSKLSLHFETSFKVTKKHLIADLTPSFVNVFSRLCRLDNVSIKSNQIDPSVTFPSLITSLQPLAPTLKQLRLDIGEYKPIKTSYAAVVKFIRSLTSIQRLQLDCLSIPQNSLFQDVIVSLDQFKYLRVFHLGNIHGTVPLAALFDGMQRILTTRGLREFSCDMSWELKRTLVGKKKMKIDISEMKRRNPVLDVHPQHIPMFEYKHDNLWRNF